MALKPHGNAALKRYLVLTIAKNIAEVREARGLTQVEVDQRIWCARSDDAHGGTTVANAERALYLPSVYTLVEISHALECKVNDLLKGVDDDGMVDEDLREDAEHGRKPGRPARGGGRQEAPARGKRTGATGTVHRTAAQARQPAAARKGRK